MTERELRFERKMTDAEAMMWNIEHDPRLSSNIGSIIICDRPPDSEILRRKVAGAVADISRMRERPVPILGRLAPPVWQPDPEFELDHHLRRAALPAPGSDRELFDLCTTLLQEPFDRTRPLWLFVVIEGLSEGRGALFTKLHHTITDGEGGVRLAERYMDLERDPPPPPEVDLEAVIRDASRSESIDTGDDLASSLVRAAGHTWRRVAGAARRTVGEAALVAADPQRLSEGAANIRKAVESASSQLAADKAGSPLWQNRSRHRYFDVLDVEFGPAKDAAKALGGSLNDFFVCGAVMGATKYHEFAGAQAEHFNVTFVVSTRSDRSAGGNAFTPSKVRVPAQKMDPADLFAHIQESMSSRRGEVTGGADLMGAVSGVANLFPTSVVTGIARTQAAAIDFATSNVRGAPIEVYVAGSKAVKAYPMGPVAGTAWNITMMSYAGKLYMGVQIDPVAVTDQDLLIRSLREGYAELISAGGVA